MLFEQLRKWRRWLLRLAALGLLLGWSLTWALDAPERPVLAERDGIRAAAAHVSGTACGQFSEGSGFAVEPGLVLTNAHVVAGMEDIELSTPDGRSEIGELVGFDPGRDIAAISVSDLGVSPVRLAPAVASAGDLGDVATVERDGDIEFVPFEVVRRVTGRGEDLLYGNEAADRTMIEIRSRIRPGDSGGALVNVDGEVVGMAVGNVPRRQPELGYSLDLVEIAEFWAETDRTPLPTPPCRTR